MTHSDHKTGCKVFDVNIVTEFTFKTLMVETVPVATSKSGLSDLHRL